MMTDICLKIILVKNDVDAWDTISVNNLSFRYLLVGRSYDHTDEDGFDIDNGEILLDLDKKKVDKKTTEQVLLAIADRLEVEDIMTAKTCWTFEIIHSAMPARGESEKYKQENFIAGYERRVGIKWY